MVALKLPNEGGTINQIILQYKRHARGRGIDYLLSREEAEQLFLDKCYYCGDPHGNLKKTKNNKKGLLYNGIDRLDSTKPYMKGNVVSCCGTCNIAKGRRSEKEFLDWIKRIHVNMADAWG